jgi:hypothetical protein
MPSRLIHVLLTALLGAALGACFPARDPGFGADGTPLTDSGSANTAAGKLSASHAGWGEACCTDCHEPDAHNEGLAPHECTGCHGTNGAPAGHTRETPCAECHGQEHRCAGFPDPVSCQTCHQGTSGEGGDDDDDERDDD